MALPDECEVPHEPLRLSELLARITAHQWISARKSALRYWEPRRIFYNLALVPSAFMGYALADTLNNVGDAHVTHYGFVFFWLILSALGANICYSFAYALEFFFGTQEAVSRWMRFGRPTLYVAGVLLGMLLALIGGRNIADLEYYHAFQLSPGSPAH